MPQNPQKRQRALMRKASQRKQMQVAMRSQQAARADPHAQFRAAANWPLYEALLAANWEQPGELIQALVARQSPGGRIAVGLFLVDLACLGVKNALSTLFSSVAEYEERLRRSVVDRQPMQKVDIHLIAKILREGMAYAQQLGFTPHPDAREALQILGNTDPDASPARIPLGGEDGKPLFVAGPYDDAQHIVAKLHARLGPGNFNYLIPINPSVDLPGFDEIEEDETEEDDL